MVGQEDVAAGKRNAANAEKKGGMKMQKVFTVIVIVAVAVLGVLNLTVKTGVEPDAVYEMANKHIEWHYAGK